MQTIRPHLLLIVTVWTASCDSAPSPAADKGVVVSSFDAAAFAPAILERELPVCADDQQCQLEAPFAAVAHDGRVVLAGMSAQIVETDSAGRFLRKIGRGGNGPGEYRWVIAGSFDKDGQLRIYDTGTSRITTYDTDGRLARTKSVPRPSHAMSGAVMRNGQLYVSTMPWPEAGHDSVDLQVMRFDEKRDEFVSIAKKRARSWTIPGSDAMRIPDFFEAPDVWDVDENGRVIWNRGTGYDIIRFDEQGRAITQLHVNIERVATTKLDVERERARRTGKGPMPPGFADQLEEAARNASQFFPAIDQLAAANDNALWVRRFTPAWTDSALWDIWIGDRPHATVQLPRNARILATDGTRRALVMTLDELDVPQLAWFRVKVHDAR
jgi:hypothetical protein